jgi:hypothetical protein
MIWPWMCEGHPGRSDEDHAERELGHPAVDRVGTGAVVGQVPGAHGEQHGAAGQDRRQEGVGEGDQLGALEQDPPDAGQLGQARGGVDRVADGVLHPGVGGQDEIGADRRAPGGAPDGRQVQLRAEQVPAEDPQAEEGRLQEEGDQ